MKKSSLISLILAMLAAILFSGCSSSEETGNRVTAQSLSQGRIGVLSGSAATVLAPELEGAAVTEFHSQSEMVSALFDGDVDYIMADYSVARNITVSNMDLSYTLSPVFGTTEFAAAVRSDDTDLYGLVIVVLKELDNKGTMDTIASNFVGLTFEAQTAGITEDVTGSNGTIVLGVDASFPPFSYVDSNGNVCGMDIEIAKTIARKGDYTLEIINMDSDGLLPSLLAGTVDLILSPITSAEGYEDTIGFTDPYYTCSQYIVYLSSD